MSSARAVQGSDAEAASVSIDSRGAAAGDYAMEGYSAGTAGGKGVGLTAGVGQRLGGSAMGGGDHRIASIPRDGSALEVSIFFVFCFVVWCGAVQLLCCVRFAPLSRCSCVLFRSRLSVLLHDMMTS